MAKPANQDRIVKAATEVVLEDHTVAIVGLACETDLHIPIHGEASRRIRAFVDGRAKELREIEADAECIRLIAPTDSLTVPLPADTRENHADLFESKDRVQN